MTESANSSRRIVEGALAGAAAGLFAAWVMSEVHDRWKAVEKGGESDPEEPTTVKAADAVAEATLGEPVPEPYRQTAGTAVHYGFGAFLGAAYGIAAELAPETT